MPKKHNKSIAIKPKNTPHSSLKATQEPDQSHGRQSSSNQAAASGSSSVNDLISHLRHTQLTNEPDSPSRQSVCWKPTRTVHPSLRNLLDVPDTPPPRPRPGARSAPGLRVRRIPGPAPPESWLSGSIHAPEDVRNRDRISVEHATQKRWRHGTYTLPEASFPPKGSLMESITKRMAKNWAFHLDYDGLWLATLSTKLKWCLLSYISQDIMTFGAANGWQTTLMTLWPREEDAKAFLEFTGVQVIDDAEDVRRLDLSGAIGTWLTVRTLIKQLQISRQRLSDSVPTAINTTSSSGTVDAHKVPDSWDDDQDEPETSNNLPEPMKPPSTLRFSNLTHLSLALSPADHQQSTMAASWSSLLSLASHLSTLTSLSLAYWPIPTVTPHAAASNARMRNPVSRSLPLVQYGATDQYAEFENEWSEAANILRKLSRRLYCLRWLDLSGCGTWWGALKWEGSSREVYDSASSTSPPRVKYGPEWNGGWRSLGFIGLDIGWTPKAWLTERNQDVQPSIHESPLPHNPVPDRYVPPAARFIGANGGLRMLVRNQAQQEESRNNLASHTSSEVIRQDWDVEVERKKYYERKELERYSELVDRAERVARHVQAIRREEGGKWIDFGLPQKENPATC
ncbi:MAG: hypothetical protein Q9227_004284 [Pyrenula ochraceoflavens]